MCSQFRGATATLQKKVIGLFQIHKIYKNLLYGFGRCLFWLPGLRRTKASRTALFATCHRLFGSTGICGCLDYNKLLCKMPCSCGHANMSAKHT